MPGRVAPVALSLGHLSLSLTEKGVPATDMGRVAWVAWAGCPGCLFSGIPFPFSHRERCPGHRHGAGCLGCLGRVAPVALSLGHLSLSLTEKGVPASDMGRCACAAWAGCPGCLFSGTPFPVSHQERCPGHRHGAGCLGCLGRLPRWPFFWDTFPSLSPRKVPRPQTCAPTIVCCPCVFPWCVALVCCPSVLPWCVALVCCRERKPHCRKQTNIQTNMHPSTNTPSQHCP